MKKKNNAMMIYYLIYLHEWDKAEDKEEEEM